MTWNNFFAYTAVDLIDNKISAIVIEMQVPKVVPIIKNMQQKSPLMM